MRDRDGDCKHRLEGAKLRLQGAESTKMKDAAIRLDEKSIELLDKSRKRLPLFMPKETKLLILDQISMQGAGVCRERGDTTVSADDILVGVYQALPSKLADFLYSRLKVDLEKQSGYKQRVFDMNHVSIDTFLRDVKVIAGKCGAKVCEDKLLPLLDCYRNIFEDNVVLIKTTTRYQNPRELYIRPGHPRRWFDLAAMARDHGVADLYNNPAYQAYASICSKFRGGGLGSMVDIGVQGNILKLFAFFSPRTKPIGRLQGCKNLPDSIFKNSALLESWGFERFAIFGVNFEDKSLNLYYYPNPVGFSRDKIISILSALDFETPSEEMLKQMEKAAVVYFTFTHANDQIERICFTRIYEDSLEEGLELVPSFRDFAKESPIKSARRHLWLGFAFSKKGHYLKVELDYKASLNIPGKMKYSRLYSSGS